MRATALVAGLCLGVTSAIAQQDGGTAEEGARCVLIGPVAVSSWLGLMSAIGDAERPALAEAAARAETLMGLHAIAGCDTLALRRALDCVPTLALGGASETDVQADAPDCIVQAGMATR